MAINDPRDISGLVLWYSAEAETSYADGASMTGWTDLSGNGNHAVAQGTLAPQWQATTGSGSGPAVKFRGTHGSTSATWGYFSLPASVMGSATAGEILMKIKSDGTDCSSTWFGSVNNSNSASHYPFSGTIYESFGSTARKTVGSPSLAITSWRRYNVWSAPSDFAARLDATTQHSTATHAVGWVTTPVIGHGGRSGVLSTNIGSFQGHMSAVILYNRKLTTTERDDLDAWLVANPHGGNVTVPAATVTLAGTVQTATAAFSVATVLAASLAGTVQPTTGQFDLSASAQVALEGTTQAPTGAFEVEAVAEEIDIALVGVAPQPTGVFEALTAASVSLAGEAQSAVAEFSLSAAAQVTLAGTVQAPTAEFVISTADRSVSLAGSARRATAAIALTGQPVVQLAGTVRPATGVLTVTTLPTVTLAGTVEPSIASFTTYVVTPVTPAPPSVSEATAVVVAVAHGAVTMQGTQPVYTVSEASTPRARQQIVVDGVDVSYFRDVVTPDVTYTLLEPLLYGPGTLDLPQVAACFDNPGSGDLAWLRPQAPVEVNLVVDDVVVGTPWKGFVAAFDINGRGLSVELGGEANGRAAMRDRQVPIFPRINDIGHQMADAVRDLGLAHQPPLGAVTGIETMTSGGTGHLDHINDLVAKSWTRSGKQWTVMPNESTGAYETHRKDATTIHGTVFIDDARTVAMLRRDIAEEPNQIFVTCVTPAGMRVRFGKYPGLVQGPVPDFPGSMQEGDSGEGVRLLVGKLHASGYLKLADVAGGFDEDVTSAVEALQEDAGILVTGVVNLATWRALYDLDVTGLSLEWANIQPAAQRSKTRKYDRSANGTIMGFNDDYDPEVIVRHRSIDLGSGVTRSQAREYARTVLHDSDDPNWVGDLTFHTGALIRGEGTEGMTLSTADVMDARELRPGMNLWLPRFDGGTLLHVAACQVNGEGVVTATVDTRFRDAMEVWEVIARNKESRNDPSRHRQRRYRASTIVKDSIGEWDEFGGMLGVDLPLKRGWNKFPVVAAMEGQIRDFGIALETPAEFAVAVWGDEPNLNWLDDLNPHPLTVTGTRVWETRGDELTRDHFLLHAAGTHKEPLGYWPGRKTWESITGEEANPAYSPDADDNTTGTDDDETITVTTTQSSGTLTGEHVDAAGFPYFAVDRKVIWVTVWVRGDNTIPLGRIMKPQMEAGA